MGPKFFASIQAHRLPHVSCINAPQGVIEPAASEVETSLHRPLSHLDGYLSKNEGSRGARDVVLRERPCLLIGLN